MTHIADELSLSQHVFSYLKQRWAAGGAAQDVRAGFGTWLATKGHTIAADMATLFNNYTLVDTPQVGDDFAAFAATNLPGDAESQQDFAARYAFDRLLARRLLTDGAYHAVVNGLQLLRSGNVVATFGQWLVSTNGAASGWNFQQKLVGFKGALRQQRGILTGEAVVTLAQAQGFDYVGWAQQRITSVRNGGNDIWLPKLAEGAACWNWALTAITPSPYHAGEIVDWLHAPLPAPSSADASMPAGVAAVNAGAQLVAKNALIAIKQEMHQHGLATSNPRYNPARLADPNVAARAKNLTERMATEIVRLCGFNVVPGPGEYGVCVEYKLADGVAWEHWWVEYGNKSVVETFPTQQFLMNLTGRRQVERMGGPQQAQYALYRVPVSDLLPEHHNRVAAGLAQYL